MPLKTKCYVSNHISLCSVRPHKLMHFQTTAVILFMKFQQIVLSSKFKALSKIHKLMLLQYTIERQKFSQFQSFNFLPFYISLCTLSFQIKSLNRKLIFSKANEFISLKSPFVLNTKLHVWHIHSRGLSIITLANFRKKTLSS